MSVTDPRLNKTEVDKPAPLYSSSTFVDANALLQKAIQKLPSEVRSGIILRCDELAHLQGTQEEIEKVFTQLLEMIVKEKEANKKLFLHITCSKENKAEKATSSAVQRFRIQFHANLSPHAAWMQKAEKQMDSIAALLVQHNGSLQVNQFKNSGCVFCITLPGK
jgi:uncharacterized protein YdiU (UPF0061 family)